MLHQEDEDEEDEEEEEKKDGANDNDDKDQIYKPSKRFPKFYGYCYTSFKYVIFELSNNEANIMIICGYNHITSSSLQLQQPLQR